MSSFEMKSADEGLGLSLENLGEFLPQVLTLVAAFLSSEDNSQLTREAVDMASKLLALDLSLQPTYELTSGWLSLLSSGSLWSMTYLTIPVILTGIVWYFIVTFLLQKNIFGRSFGSRARVESQEEHLDDLTTKVNEALDHPR
ncbi:uncharacterized protein LOC122264960 [Penaeus japonicus]|uniref:uncharacterized protein LOC122264960 n=1 Tax=Penaeus japonicus TaxID=27405 RepID=UPI001C70F2FB|nr:uncharacterized protein LOC122264960 [Penaeus japonicus]